MSFCGWIIVVKPGGVTPYSIGCVRPRPPKMDHIAFHRSSAVRVETVNDLMSVFGRVLESRYNSKRIGPPNRPVALETNEYDIASAAMPADSNKRAATTRISIYRNPRSATARIRNGVRILSKLGTRTVRGSLHRLVRSF